MYEAFFGFERAPFENVPDTSFFFPSSTHTEALAQLTYAVEARKGFAVLTGEVGIGQDDAHAGAVPEARSEDGHRRRSPTAGSPACSCSTPSAASSGSRT